MNPGRPLFPELGPWTTVALQHGLTDRAAAPDGPLDDELDLICDQKLGPFLLHFLRSTGADVDPRLRRRLEDDTAARVAHMARTSRLGATVQSELHAAGVEVVVTKGVGLAAHYRWPWARTSTDVDVLVSPCAFPRALALLQEHGWRELARSRQPWPVFNLWCRESVNLVAAPTTSVDLHHRVSPWSWSRRLGAATVLGASLAGCNGVQVACGADNLAVAALQLVGEHRRPGSKLIAWRDIAELGHSLEPHATARRLQQTRTAGTVGWLLRQLPDAIRPAELTALLPVRPERPRRLQLMLAAARHERALAAHVLRLPVLRAAAFLAGTAFPSRSFLAAHHAEPRGRRRAWWRSMLRSDARSDQAVDVDRGTGPPQPRRRDPAEFHVLDDRVAWARDDDGRVVVVVDRASAERVEISRSGVPLWDALTRGATAADLALVLTAVHGLDPDLAQRHAAAFLEMVSGRRWVGQPTDDVG